MSTSNVKERLSEFYNKISDDLDRCVQFWLQHSVDEEHGGFFTCLDAEGKVFDTNKYVWPICRQVWVFARLYQDVARFHQPHILDMAKKGADFVMQHAKNKENNKCYISLTRDGKPIKTQRSIFSECFYVMAMSEMYRVLKDDVYKKEAMTMMGLIVHWVKVDNAGLGLPLVPPVATSSLSVPMMLLCLIDQLESMDPDHKDNFKDLADWCTDRVLKHVQRNSSAVLETVTEEGEEVSGSAGRLMNPGHAIESGWFLLKRAVKNNNEELQKTAIDAFIMESFKRGWDEEHGGLLYFIDVDGRPPLQLEWDMKLWWPHNEAMIAFLMAYKQTQNEMYLEKFAQVFDYAYKHFVDPHNGEWFGYLNREGKVKIDAKGGNWKGCFHVPRCLMICEQLLHEILQNK